MKKVVPAIMVDDWVDPGKLFAARKDADFQWLMNEICYRALKAIDLANQRSAKRI